jgi:GNAT superfamily N-acetyltransferase
MSKASSSFVVRIRNATSSDGDACAHIVQGLPEYFTDDVPDTVRRDLDRHGGWVLADTEVVAFVIAQARGTQAAEILWAAVRADRRHEGLGTQLVEHALDELAGRGIRVVEVKTLDHSSDYAPYASTRAFWERRGFVQVDTIDPLPGWRPGNPSAIYVAAVAPTR